MSEKPDFPPASSFRIARGLKWVLSLGAPLLAVVLPLASIFFLSGFWACVAARRACPGWTK